MLRMLRMVSVLDLLVANTPPPRESTAEGEEERGQQLASPITIVRADI